MNILVPVTLSFKQVILIALEVIKICDKRGIELRDISPKQLDELIELVIQSVKQVFKDNCFRFLPDIVLPAFVSGELIR